MRILEERINASMLKQIETETYFDDMIKAVVDIDKQLIAVNAELHSDLEVLLLDNGSKQSHLYGINIMLDTFETEFDSLINPPRNREAGYPRGGRYVCDPDVRNKIEEIVDKWIER